MADEQEDWTPGQVKRSLDEKITAMERAIDVAREGVPPHVTIQDYFEMLLDEREKAVQLALTAADKLEQERLGRNADAIEAEARISELTRLLSDTAILKAEAAGDKRFDEFASTIKEQIADLRETVQGLVQRIDRLV